MQAIGIDVGAGRLHLVAVIASPSGELSLAGRLICSSPARCADFCETAARVAIDAPSGPSAGAHLADRSVAPKFRAGRCSEIPVPGVPPVSWITPMLGRPVPGWMASGFEVWAALRSAGHEPVETFPAGCYHRLNGGRWPPRKTLPAGLARRVELLTAAGLDLPPLEWTHDDLDAAAAALVAARGRPLPHRCPAPDGSVMWLL